MDPASGDSGEDRKTQVLVDVDVDDDALFAAADDIALGCDGADGEHDVDDKVAKLFDSLSSDDEGEFLGGGGPTPVADCCGKILTVGR